MEHYKLVLAPLQSTFKGIQNLAISWEHFHLLINAGWEIPWFRFLDEVKVFTVVYTRREEVLESWEWNKLPTPRLMDFKPDTLRHINSKKMQWWVEKVFERFNKEFPEHPMSKLRIEEVWMPQTDGDNAVDNIKWEEDFDEYYDREAWVHFGDMPDMP